MNLVTRMYFLDYFKCDVARFYFLIMLPTFVDKYDLRGNIFSSENYPLYVQLLACAIDHINGQVKEINNVENSDFQRRD